MPSPFSDPRLTPKQGSFFRFFHVEEKLKNHGTFIFRGSRCGSNRTRTYDTPGMKLNF